MLINLNIMAFDPNDLKQKTNLYFYMGNFLHLLCARLDFQFSIPPPSTVKEAQERSVYDFFISLRHQDSETYALTLANELQEFGYRVYFVGQALGWTINCSENNSARHCTSLVYSRWLEAAICLIANG